MNVTRQKLAKSAACALAACMLVAGAAGAQDRLLIRNLNVVHLESDRIDDGFSMLIENGFIVEIAPSINLNAPDLREIDAAGAYAIPGLWDSHVHIFSTETEPDTALRMYLINGVTGIRDMGALWPFSAQQQLQDQIDRGEVLGPRLILSGAWIDAPPGSWPGMFLANDPSDAEAAVTQIAAEGWAAVKTYSMLDEATYLAIADATARAGLPLVGHIPEQVALRTAIGAGQNGMEHFGRVTMACSTREAEMVEALRAAMARDAELSEVFAIMGTRNAIILDSWDEALCDTVLSDMAQADLHISPTLVVADFYTGNWPEADAPRMQMIPAEVANAWGEPDFRLDAMTDEILSLAEASIALDRQTFLLAHRAGVPILASSDASFANPFLFHGFSLLDELDIYVETGLTPREALITATVSPARFFALPDQYGRIEAGQRADLVLLAENPLDSLATLREPVAVIANGRLIDRAQLTQMRQDLIAEAHQ